MWLRETYIFFLQYIFVLLGFSMYNGYPMFFRAMVSLCMHHDFVQYFAASFCRILHVLQSYVHAVFGCVFF